MTDAAVPTSDDAMVLSGPLTMQTVGDIRQRMLDCLAGGSACVLHAAGVTQLDAAGAQLLYAFVAEIARRGGTARWASASLFMVEAARMLGMESCLGLAGLPPEVASWQP
jgi:ABC-type transporter Mla MlaB component